MKRLLTLGSALALAGAVFGQCTFDPDHLGDLPIPGALWPSEPVPAYLCETSYDHDISVIVPAEVELLPLITCTINSVTIVDLLGLPGDYAVDYTGNGGSNVYPGGTFSCAEIKSSNPSSAAAGDYPLELSLINDLSCPVLGDLVVPDTISADSLSQTLRVVACSDCEDAVPGAPTGTYTLLRNVSQVLELSWGRVQGAVGYRISGGPIPVLANLSPQLGETNTSATINYAQLSSGATYRWGVAAGCGTLPTPAITALSEFDTFDSPTLRLGAIAEEEIAATMTMTAFPNPTTDFIMLEIQSQQENEAVVNVFDIAGRMVMSQNAAIFEGGNMIKYDLDLEPGQYIVELGMGEETVTQQITVTQ